MTPAARVDFPVNLDLSDRDVLVVGGGAVAARKVEALRRAGARVTVVATALGAELAARDDIVVSSRPYRRGELARYWFVVAATADPVLNRAVFEDGQLARVWVNAVDDPDCCSATLPALHRDGPVTVAVSTGGTSPSLAAWLRDRVAQWLPGGLGAVAGRLAAERAALHDAGQSTEGRDWPARIETLLETAPTPGQRDGAQPNTRDNVAPISCSRSAEESLSVSRNAATASA